MHLGEHPPVICPKPVGPAGPAAGLEPGEATVDAVEAVGVVVTEDTLECVAGDEADASVTVGDADLVE